MDEHVPNAVALALRRRAVDVRTAEEAGLLGAPDEDYLAHSRAAGRVLVTHDSDFLRLHRQNQRHAGIAYSQQGTRTIGELVAGLVVIYEVLDSGEMVGQVEFI